MRVAEIAADLVRKVRAGELDPHPASVALGLPFDQDIVMAILERAAVPYPSEDDLARTLCAERGIGPIGTIRMYANAVSAGLRQETGAHD